MVNESKRKPVNIAEQSLKILICPKCRGDLHNKVEKLVCNGCCTSYQVKKTIPILFTDKVSENEKTIGDFYNLNPYDIYSEEDFSLKDFSKSKFASKIIKNVGHKDSVIDVGCGVGKYLRIFSQKKIFAVGVDQSIESLQRIKKECHDAILINASNLHLPIRDASFSVVISTGVIHHTGNALTSFRELVRILKPGGRLYLAVYRKWGRHHLVYASLGFVLRSLYYSKVSFGRQAVDRLIFPVFYIVDKYFFKKKRPYYKSRALLFDTFLHPVVSFHTEREIKSWSKIAKLKNSFYDCDYHDLIFVVFLKK